MICELNECIFVSLNNAKNYFGTKIVKISIRINMIASEMSAINKSNEINYCLGLWFGIASIKTFT